MRNKIFFITIIISLLLHFWVLQILDDFFDFSYPEIKEKPILSAKIEFISTSVIQTVEEYIEQPADIQDSLIGITAEVTDAKEMEQNKETKILKKEDENIQKENEADDLLEKIKMSVQPDVKEVVVENNQKEQQVTPGNDHSLKKDLPVEIENMLPESEITEKVPLKQKEELEEVQLLESLPLDFTETGIIDQQVIEPTIIHFHSPEYPPGLQRRNIEGKVQLKVLIDIEGNVVETHINHSSGYQDFDQAAVKSVLQWKFEPAKLNNIKRSSWVYIPVIFKLK